MDSKVLPLPQRTEFSFRFFSTDTEHLALLTDSLSRVISEIYFYFPETPVNFSVNAVPCFNKYPLSKKHGDDVIAFDIIDIPVYFTKSFFSGSAITDESVEEDSNSAIAILYKEQFVVRLDVSIPKNQTETTYLHMKNALSNILQNADVPNVSLLSLVLDKECAEFPFSVVECLPTSREKGHAYMPLKMPFKRTSSSTSVFSRGWIDDNGFLSSVDIERDLAFNMGGSDALFTSKTPTGEDVRTRVLSLGGKKVRLRTKYAVSEWALKVSLAVCNKGLPIWSVSNDDSITSLERIVFCPQFSDVKSVIKSQADFPVNMMFGDMAGSELNWVFLASKIKPLSTWMQDGAEIYRLIADDGSVSYNFSVIHDAGGLTPCFEGTEPVLITYLEKLIEKVIPLDCSAALQLAQELGCAPAEFGEFLELDEI
jgi:hypothetical protein